MTKLKSIGGSLAVIIPADIVRQAGLKKGQPVDVAYADGRSLHRAGGEAGLGVVLRARDRP